MYWFSRIEVARKTLLFKFELCQWHVVKRTGYRFYRFRLPLPSVALRRAHQLSETPRELQVRRIKNLLLAYSPGGGLVINHCWCSDLKELLIATGSFSPVDSPVQIIEGSLSILFIEMAVCAVHDIMEMHLLWSEFGTEVTSIHGAILVSAQSDSYLLFVICFSSFCTDKADGHQKKQYLDTFSSFLSKASNQLIVCIKTCVEVTCSEELSICSPSIRDAATLNGTSKAAILKIYMLPLKTNGVRLLEVG